MNTGLKLVENQLDNLNIHDSTKLECYTRCPREYFFSYVLHLRSRYTNLHLQFGQDVHNGFEVLDELDWAEDALEPALDAFKNGFQEAYSPALWESKAPKNADGAEAIFKAALSADHSSEITLMREIAIPVRINEVEVLWCKMDKIYVSDGTIRTLDYKTSGKLYKDMKERLIARNQFKAYTAALKFHFSKKGKIGNLQTIVCIPYKNAVKNASSVPYFYGKGKSENGNGHALLLKIDCAYDDYDLEEWRKTTERKIKEVNEDVDKLTNFTDRLPKMDTFPKNSGSCFSFNSRCAFFDLCHKDKFTKANPLILANREHAPVGFRKEIWNPKESGKFILKDGKASLLSKDPDIKAKTKSKQQDGFMSKLIGD